ncbi:hypothetical protein NDU88_000545 [Pleurodeles waltl]|uniref:Uncharacterized protein n=1 Tax=Pleurodeles waltl TaxID=8319 RepID=A0AAV7UTD8_PLEWA|nr:hypothetical protein NDU88_000545 [Pleurodeles waltl]
MDGGDGDSGKEKETRSAIGGDRREGDFVAAEYQHEDLHDESEAQRHPEQAPATLEGRRGHRSQEHPTTTWWEEAPFVSSELEAPKDRQKLSKKKK